VANIREGTGPYDLADDAVSLALLFERHWARLKGLHPLRFEDLTALREDGQWLLEHLTPLHTRRSLAPKTDPARDLRDRLWTMLQERYEWLRRVAFYFHGDDAQARVPPLLSRLVSVAAEEEDADGQGPEASPAATPDAVKPSEPPPRPPAVNGSSSQGALPPS
jgi:hypothetical protein